MPWACLWGIILIMLIEMKCFANCGQNLSLASTIDYKNREKEISNSHPSMLPNYRCAVVNCFRLLLLLWLLYSWAWRWNKSFVPCFLYSGYCSIATGKRNQVDVSVVCRNWGERAKDDLKEVGYGRVSSLAVTFLFAPTPLLPTLNGPVCFTIWSSAWYSNYKSCF